MDSWFVRMTAVKDKIIDYNSQVEVELSKVPTHVGKGLILILFVYLVHLFPED